MDLREKIVLYAKDLGIENIGFTALRPFEELREFYEKRKKAGVENEFEEQDIEKRINPGYYMEKGKTIISMAFPYLYSTDLIDNGFSKYTRGIDYHHVVKLYLEKISQLLKQEGYEAIYFVDSNSLPERYIAYLSGVGFIGKNNMLITEKYGSYVFLGEIITDAYIEPSTQRNFSDIMKFQQCGSCNKCILECPTKAINNIKRNSNICLSYITQKKKLEDIDIKRLGGRVFGCDSCQNVCPFNEKVEFTKIEEFKPLEFMNIAMEQQILNMDNSTFKKTIKNTSCGWRGKNILQRNMLIRKGIFFKEDISQEKFQSPYLTEYIERIKHIKGDEND